MQEKTPFRSYLIYFPNVWEGVPDTDLTGLKTIHNASGVSRTSDTFDPMPNTLPT